MENQVVVVLPQERPHQPCAACRMLRRRCDSKCVLAPYFKGDDVEKFAGVHKVFGASNVIKMIQMVDESRREDAVQAIKYEASARLRDPVYGSTRVICHLQKMVEELKSELESTKAQVLELQGQRDQLLPVLMNLQSVRDGFTSASGVDQSELGCWNFPAQNDDIEFDVHDTFMDFDAFESPAELDYVL